MNEISWHREKDGTWHFSFFIGNEKFQFITTDNNEAQKILNKAFKLRKQWNIAMEKLKNSAKEMADA